MKKYSARDYLSAFEPWVLEDVSALADILEADTRLAHDVAHKLLISHDSDGRYPVEVWLGVHPLYNKKCAPQLDCRRVQPKLAKPQHFNS